MLVDLFLDSIKNEFNSIPDVSINNHRQLDFYTMLSNRSLLKAIWTTKVGVE